MDKSAVGLKTLMDSSWKTGGERYSAVQSHSCGLIFTSRQHCARTLDALSIYLKRFHQSLVGICYRHGVLTQFCFNGLVLHLHYVLL